MCVRADCSGGRVRSFAGSMACPSCRPGARVHLLGLATQMAMLRETIERAFGQNQVADELVQAAAERIKAEHPDLFREPPARLIGLNGQPR